MTATLTPNRLGPLQMGALGLLAKRKRMTAVEIRDAIGLPADDEGTRKAHSVLRRLVDRGFLAREGRVGDNRIKGTASFVRFSITTEGREARKEARS